MHNDQFFSILTTTLSTNNLLFDIVNKIIRYNSATTW